jgi:hypothetical protein
LENWSPTLQLWKLEFNASALEIGVQTFRFGRFLESKPLDLEVQRFSFGRFLESKPLDLEVQRFGNWSPTL